MAIFVDENTKVIYQGLTGSQGRFYGLLNRDYGTKVVAGTNPRKAGTDVEGIPVFATVGEAVEATGATRSEERRVGKECRARWRPDRSKKERREKQRQRGQ